MHAAILSAHKAYRHAAQLAPERPTTVAEPEPVDVTWQWVSEQPGEEVQVRGSHALAVGGTAIFLVAGALCGMWLQLG